MSSSGAIQVPPATTVIAVDFGSVGTGFGYSIKGSDPRLWHTFPEAPRQYPKTLTAILYRNTEPISIGYEAQNEYEIHAAEGNIPDGSVSTSPKYYLVKFFKLLLHNPSSRLVQLLPPGITKIQLIADFLSLFKRYIFTSLRAEVGPTGQHLVAPGAITWVVTVPALWSYGPKSDMRDACVRAGFINRDNPEQLVMALEPESAALWAKHIKVTSFETGQVVMVVDAGGGTVDWTVHNCVERGGETVLAEATSALGAPLGSLKLDLAALDLVKDRVGSQAFDEWQQLHPLDVLQLQNCWENIKCTFNPGSDAFDDGKFISIPDTLYAMMGSEDKERLMAQYGFDDVILIDNETMRGLFDVTINEIVEITNRQLNLVETKVDKVLLVGGFSSSVYMQQRLRREVNNPRVVPVFHPYAAVLRGAVLFGKQPHLIHARRSRYSYGVRVAAPHVDGAPRKFWHLEQQMFFSNGFFKCFVEKGKSVGYSESVEHVFEPLHLEDTASVVEIYLMDSPSKRFLDDDDIDARHLATLKVEHPRADGCLEDRRIQVTFHFGRVEVVASAVEVSTQELRTTSFRFASL